MSTRATILAALMGSTILAGAALAQGPSDMSLVAAAKQGDRATVQALIGHTKGIAAGAEGTAALVWAATHNDLAMADLLLKAGASAKAANEFGATALYAAAEQSDPAMATKLLAAGADPNMPIMSGETPLMVASSRGNVETVKALLSGGAKPNAQENMGGQTAMMWAISKRQSAVVDELVKHGADVELADRKSTRLNSSHGSISYAASCLTKETTH